MKILLIDDEIDFCVQAKDYLQSQGHIVATESDGDLALDKVDVLAPDIVILDVDLGLRGIDGRAICAQLSRSDAYADGNLGIIMISGHYIAPSDELLGFEVGADNYLIKPFELSQLVARINALSRRLNTHNHSVLTLDNTLSIHFDSREVFVNNTPAALSRLEFNVLAYLARPPGTARTKAELLENVWSTPHIEEGAIAKCMSILRRKLSVSQSVDYIQTVYGVGYRLSGAELEALSVGD